MGERRCGADARLMERLLAGLAGRVPAVLPRPLLRVRNSVAVRRLCSRKEAVRLDFGCGPRPRLGCVGVDVRPVSGALVVCASWETPFPPCSVEEVYSRQMLGHLSRRDAERTVRHWFRILKPGGRLDVNVPDLRKAIEQLDMCGLSPYVRREVTHWEHGMCSIYGWQQHGHDFHRWGYTERTLGELLSSAGFEDVRRLPETESLAGPLILRMVARKPEAPCGT